jgi:hypothetical protein
LLIAGTLPPFKLHLRHPLNSKPTLSDHAPNFQILVYSFFPPENCAKYQSARLLDLQEFPTLVAASSASFLTVSKLLCSPHTNDDTLTNIGYPLCCVILRFYTKTLNYKGCVINTDLMMASTGACGCKTLLPGYHCIAKVPSRREVNLSGDAGCF